ncbi:MAG: sodium:solute symporter family protein [Elusimicrobiota bacterium]|mgnify:CR=1 FL=1
MIDALLVGLFLAVAVTLGARARRGKENSLEDYILASRALTLPQFVATLVPTFYGGVLGIGEFAWTSGLSNWMVMALPYYVFAALYALFLAERVRLTPGLTIPDHLESAYGRGSALIGAFLVFVLASPADELLMAGTLLSHLSGLPVALAMAVAAAAALALVWRGGLHADVAAHRLQLVVMFVGFALVLPFALKSVGGPAALAERLPAGHLSWTGGLGPWKILGWWLIAVWTIVDPSFHQRCAAAKSPATARRGILLSIAFWMLFDLMTTTAGLYARALLPTLDAPTLAFPRLADATMPVFARGLFFAGVSASLFAALQGTSLVSAVSLGKDLFGRLSPVDQAGQRRRVRGALALTGLLAFILARLVPSVVDLWYSVGSAVIAGLLLPMLGVYAPRLRVGPRWAVAASVSGFAASLIWVAAARSMGASPFGIEAPFPGLVLSALVWTFGKYSVNSSGRG